MPAPRPVGPARLAAVVALAVALGACTAEEPEPAGPASPATMEPTPLEEVETAGVRVDRADPCPDLPAEAAVEALGSEVAATERWGNGEPARLSPGVRDVAHEWGCAFRAADGGTARAWLFVPPLTPARAREVARAVAADEECAALAGAAAFGAPTSARTCRREGRRGPLEVAWSGLFGDAWLSCSLTAPGRAVTTAVARTALVERAGAWCAQVLAAARAD